MYRKLIFPIVLLFLIPALLNAQGLHQHKPDSLTLRLQAFKDSILRIDTSNTVKWVNYGKGEHEIIINLQWNINDNIDRIDRFQRVVALRVLNEVIQKRSGSFDVLVRYQLRKHVLSSCTSYIENGQIVNAQCSYIKNSEYYTLTKKQ